MATRKKVNEGTAQPLTEPVVVDEPVVAEVSAAPEETPNQTAPEPSEPEAVPPIPSDVVVTVRLMGAATAMLGGVAVFRHEARQVSYASLLEAMRYHPGKFSVKYPGSNEFVPA